MLLQFHVNFIRVSAPIPLEKNAIAKQFDNDSSFYVYARRILCECSVSSYTCLNMLR